MGKKTKAQKIFYSAKQPIQIKQLILVIFTTCFPVVQLTVEYYRLGGVITEKILRKDLNSTRYVPCLRLR